MLALAHDRSSAPSAGRKSGSGGQHVTVTQLLEVSDLAAQKFNDILKEQDEDAGMLRVMVMPGANGGIQYMLSVEQDAGVDDFVIDTSTIQVLVDADSAPLLDGSTIDYMEGLMRSGFVISNPNFQAGGGGCGCGGGGGGCGGGGGGGGCGCGGGGGGGGCGCGGGGGGGGGEGCGCGGH